MPVIVAHLLVGLVFGLSTAAASLLLGHPAATAFCIYVLAGALGVIASGVATLPGSGHQSSGSR
jgi:hypothetical protein